MARNFGRALGRPTDDFLPEWSPLDLCLFAYLPEDSVVDVAAAVELDRVGELDALGDIALGRCFLKSFVGDVQVVDVGSVVLGVVKFHDVGGDVGLKSVVFVWKLGESGLGSAAENTEDSSSHHFIF